MLSDSLFDETLNLYRDSKSRSITLDCIRSLLSGEAYQKCFVAHINQVLSSSSTRLDGLQLISECSDRISPDVFEEQGSFWIECCISHYQHSQNKEVYLKTLRNIMEYHQKNSDFSKKVANDFLTRLLDICLNADKDLCIMKASIECILACLKYYSSFCKHYKSKIEDYLIGFLNSSSEGLVEEAGRALVYSQKIPTSGNSKISCIQNMTLLLRKLCASCHHYLDDIFEQVLEIQQFKVEDIEPFDIQSPPPHYNSYLKLQYQTQIIINALHWIRILFAEGLNITVYTEIFSVLERGLSLHKCLKENSLNTKYSSFSLLKIQIEILQVLSLLILSLKSRVVPFYPLISEIMRDILNKNKNCDCYINCSVFQEYFYEVLLNLLLTGHGLEKPLQNALVCQIIKNNTAIEDGVTVKINSNMPGKSSKTKQKIILKSLSSKINSFDIASSWKKDKIGAPSSSLKGLLILMKFNLDTEILKEITEFVIENILIIQKGNLKAPFTNDEYQELLYEILCSLFEQDNTSIYDKYGEQINEILITGWINGNLNISATCHEGLQNMERTFQALNYSESSSNLKCGYGISQSEKNNLSDIVLEENEIKILQNNVLVPAKIERQTTDELEEDTIPNEKENEVMEDIEISTNLVHNEIDVNTSIDLEEKNFVIEEYSSMKNENYGEEDIQSEPVLKKSKAEVDVASLFVTKFNKYYQ